MTDYENLQGDVERFEIPLDNDYVIRRTEMKRWDRTARDWVLIQNAPATGWISEERGGTPIHPSLETDLLFGAPGDCDGQLEGQDVAAHLAAFEGRPVWDNVRVTTGGDSDYLDSREIFVVATATPRVR